MTGMDPDHFRAQIIRPTLERIGLAGLAAELLLLGTAFAESDLTYLRQIGGGPALGVYQIEPGTHLDLWRYLDRPDKAFLRSAVKTQIIRGIDLEEQLAGNLYYATAMARVRYWMVPAKLPEADDIVGLSFYWKKYFNTEGGDGEPKKYQRRLRRYLSMPM